MPEITDSLKAAVVAALADGYEEGAVEAVFAVYPDLTRDQAVDVVEAIERDWLATFTFGRIVDGRVEETR